MILIVVVVIVVVIVISGCLADWLLTSILKLPVPVPFDLGDLDLTELEPALELGSLLDALFVLRTITFFV